MILLLARARTLLPLAGAGLAAALLAAGCGGSTEEQPPLLPAALAADLAARSESVARTLGRGDDCAAARRARHLRAAVDRASAEGRIPVDLRRELRRRTSDLLRSIVCVKPPPPPARDDAEDEDRDEDEDDTHADEDDD